MTRLQRQDASTRPVPFRRDTELLAEIPRPEWDDEPTWPGEETESTSRKTVRIPIITDGDE